MSGDEGLGALCLCEGLSRRVVGICINTNVMSIDNGLVQWAHVHVNVVLLRLALPIEGVICSPNVTPCIVQDVQDGIAALAKLPTSLLWT
jgi:hypothetical protein